MRSTAWGTAAGTTLSEGNRTRRTAIAGGAYVDYTWDHRNRLTDVTYKTSGGTTTKKAHYTYDVFDRRIGKQVDDDGGGTYDRTSRYVYDGSDIVLVYDGASSLTNRYLSGPAVDQVFADENALATILWGLANYEGTVRDVAQYNSGTNTTTVVNHLKYDAFGKITAQSDSTKTPLFAFTGREWDADADLFYYRARWYDHRVGRFISEDPMGFAAGDVNLSRYVANAPTNYRDPSGMEGEDLEDDQDRNCINDSEARRNYADWMHGMF